MNGSLMSGWIPAWYATAFAGVNESVPQEPSCASRSVSGLARFREAESQLRTLATGGSVLECGTGVARGKVCGERFSSRVIEGAPAGGGPSSGAPSGDRIQQFLEIDLQVL